MYHCRPFRADLGPILDHRGEPITAYFVECAGCSEVYPQATDKNGKRRAPVHMLRVVPRDKDNNECGPIHYACHGCSKAAADLVADEYKARTVHLLSVDEAGEPESTYTLNRGDWAYKRSEYEGKMVSW